MTIDTPNAVYMTRLTFANGRSDNVGGAVRIDQGQVYAANCFDDLYGSLYESAVYALTGAGAFCGDCGGSFDAEGICVSCGQFLTVLTRFVEPERGYVGRALMY